MLNGEQLSIYVPLIAAGIALFGVLEVQRRTQRFERTKDERNIARLDAAVRTQLIAYLRLEAFYVRILFQSGDPSVALPVWRKVHDNLRNRLAQIDVAMAFPVEQCEKLYMVLINGDIAIELLERSVIEAPGDEEESIKAMRSVQSGVKPIFDTYIDLFTALGDTTEIESFAYSAKERVKYAVLFDEHDDFLAF